MAKVRFNLNQLNNPTPAKIDRGFKIFIGIAGVLVGWMPTSNVVPTSIQEVITPILGLLISIAVVLAPLFGIEVDRKSIPTSDVTTMENKTLKRKT
jgi:hypothetical protein